MMKSLSVIFQLLSICAQERIIVYNANKKPIDPGTTFETVNNRVLHDVLMEYINTHQTQIDFANKLYKMYKHVKMDINSAVKPQVNTMKRIMIKMILDEYKIGEFHADMLHLASSFDKELYDHLQALCMYDFEHITGSMQTSLEKYDLFHYKINRSVGYFALALVTYIYELILFQVERSRWAWVDGDAFEMQLKLAMPNIRLCLGFIFEQKGYRNTTIDFQLPKIFTQEIKNDDIKSRLKSDDKSKIEILVVYSYDEVLEMFSGRDFLASCKNIDALSSEMTSDLKLNFYSSKFIHYMNRNFLCDKIVNHPTFLCRGITKYELLFNAGKEVCGNFDCDIWKFAAIDIEKKSLAVEKFVADWVTANMWTLAHMREFR